MTLHVGDALEVLRTLPDGSANCVVTSPPYWGLRDYGTGTWEGGDESCDHLEKVGGTGSSTLGAASGGNDMSDAARERSTTRSYVSYRDVCGKCGARRVDRQLGLEGTPEQYVAGMVAVFAEVRRVLADDGTLWLNLGDSYANDTKWGGATGGKHVAALHGTAGGLGREKRATGLKQKDLVGVPWSVAFALRADGWYLRSDVIWAKPNPMPESVTDRPTKAHEYVFLLSKGPRYYFDQEAVREPHTSTRWGGATITQPPDTKYAEATANGFAGAAEALSRPGREWNAYPDAGRNVRSVWSIATQPYPNAHFATFPEELARRCILAGCPEWVCGTCGKPRERIVERGELVPTRANHDLRPYGVVRGSPDLNDQGSNRARDGHRANMAYERLAVGWSNCGHNNYRPGVVLDPFLGSGTVAVVALRERRKWVGIELNPEYAALAQKRIGSWWKQAARPPKTPAEQETLFALGESE